MQGCFFRSINTDYMQSVVAQVYTDSDDLALTEFFNIRTLAAGLK